MENLIWIVPVLACPVGMLLMMLLMGKGMGMMSPKDAKADGASESRALDELRDERDRLSAEIGDRERADARSEPTGRVSHV